MTDEARVTFLNRILSGTVNSMIQYTAVSVPYVALGCEPFVERMDKMRGEEIEQVNTLTKLISRFRGVPSTEAFPYWNVDPDQQMSDDPQVGYESRDRWAMIRSYRLVHWPTPPTICPPRQSARHIHE